MTLPPLPADPWSIGLYAGTDPLHLAPIPGLLNPILTREQVTDIPAAFVADPFLLPHGDEWHLFFEVLHHGRGIGEIGWASSSDMRAWHYGGIVLSESFHLSYPHVFPHAGDIYMMPETLGAGAVRLYRAAPFPSRWVQVAELVQGQLADPTPFHFDERWWMFACSAPSRHDALKLFHANALEGPWSEHPASPLIHADKRRARPGGRVVLSSGRPLRFAQDCGERYGSGVRAFELTELTIDRFAERECAESPIIGASGAGWNGKGMHHVDAWQLSDGQWIAAVDGIKP